MSSQVLTRCKHSDAKAKSSKAKMQHKVIIFNFPVWHHDISTYNGIGLQENKFDNPQDCKSISQEYHFYPTTEGV